MSNYVKSTDFAAKDALLTGNPAKIIKGTEIDTEFSNIATAVSTKADTASPTFTGTPAAPTAANGTSTTQLATTAFATTAVTNERTATATLTNKTLTSPTINSGTINTANLNTPVVTNYTETVSSSTGNTTLDLNNGTVFKVTTDGNNTVTLPSSVAGKSFIVIVAYTGTHTITWAGGSTIKWHFGTEPVQTKVSGKFDIFSFFQDGTNTYGSAFGQSF